ncbi:MAG TPA: hypothetical protein VGG49_10135 [Steroidobacteraceae bacterium]|jgi:molybdate transport system regulatory protein
MNKSTAIIGVRLRVDIGPDCSIGPGKIALLEQVERSGSLSKAARILKMSYRRAWLLLEDLNRTLGQPATTASVGGAGGGGAQITPFGRHVIAAFRDIERAAAAAAAQQLEWLLESGVKATAEPVAPRRAVTRSLAKARGQLPGAAHTADAGLGEPRAAAVPAPTESAARLKPLAAGPHPKKRGPAMKRT